MASSDVNKLLDDWAAAWSSHDPKRLPALFTDDGVFEDVPFGVVTRNKEELLGFATSVFAAVPDFAIESTRRIALGEWVAIEWVMSGTHLGDFPGMPTTGKRFSSIRGSSILELQGGRIRRESDYWDAATLMKQIGLLPS